MDTGFLITLIGKQGEDVLKLGRPSKGDGAG
ncbi:hypothetical protein SAMN05216353_103172 [Halobacillus alkaliphilus]|uniref:Uncharacterized protein n=1 Tax=Halobacillus alkaliphilus TaxID=396056 RepID=A0A1I2K7H1_9BACI|nr:hypothetical protein SAMN05216353_103172 [Halobacillus alkaliphilus]